MAKSRQKQVSLQRSSDVSSTQGLGILNRVVIMWYKGSGVSGAWFEIHAITTLRSNGSKVRAGRLSGSLPQSSQGADEQRKQSAEESHTARLPTWKHKEKENLKEEMYCLNNTTYCNGSQFLNYVQEKGRRNLPLRSHYYRSQSSLATFQRCPYSHSWTESWQCQVEGYQDNDQNCPVNFPWSLQWSGSGWLFLVMQVFKEWSKGG